MSDLKPVPESKPLSFALKSQEYRIYRPSKDNKGAATKWNIRVKQEKYRDVMVFVEGAVQTGTDKNGNASFSWKDNVVKMKLDSPDLGSILYTLQGKNKECKLFHKNEKGNATLTLTASDKNVGSFYLKISSQQNGKVKAVQHSISYAEAEILIILLKDAVSAIYSWN